MSNKEDSKCAPSKEYKDGSCLPVSSLVELAKGWNNFVEKNKKPDLKPINIDSPDYTLNTSKFKLYLIEQFNEKFKNICNDQLCWIKQEFTKYVDKKTFDDIQNNTWKPRGPTAMNKTTKNKWLNTIDINAEMIQYESKYLDFKFLGAVPLDFNDLKLDIDDKIVKGFSGVDYNKYYDNGKYKFGAIINLDRSGEPGSHWVGLFFDIKNNQIYFSDSTGHEPDEEIRKFMRFMANYCLTKNKIKKNELVVNHNKTEHQRGNSECGVYSINFILRLLKGETFEQITTKRLDDAEVQKCRDVYFIDEKL